MREKIFKIIAASLIVYNISCIHCVCRRNEQIIGIRAFLTKQPGGTMTVTGDDPKKFAAAMVEYSKEKVGCRRG